VTCCTKSADYHLSSAPYMCSDPRHFVFVVKCSLPGIIQNLEFRERDFSFNAQTHADPGSSIPVFVRLLIWSKSGLATAFVDLEKTAVQPVCTINTWVSLYADSAEQARIPPSLPMYHTTLSLWDAAYSIERQMTHLTVCAKAPAGCVLAQTPSRSDKLR
jgi:hypothetical protein